MKNKIIVILLLMSLPMWSGCAVLHGRPDRAVYEDLVAERLKIKYSGENSIPINKIITVEERNQILDELIFLTDVNYYRFEAQLHQSRAWFDTTTDLAILGLGSAGALLTVSGTQAIISAISGGIGGTRTTINKDYFQEQSTQALIAKMQSARKSKLDLMRKAMTLDVKDYPLFRGLEDLVEYYNAGTIRGALQNIITDSGAEAKKADEELTKTITSKYNKDAASDILRAYWKPDGKTIDKNNSMKIAKWMEENQLDGVSIPFFLYSDMFKEARAKAVVDLGLAK